ncbi:chalcone isomerase domain-containing protein [Aspergillus clavatus NRRL 1]|uniref:Chalcone isomerase domain-containing protein n=1 Tax=Aspergillus clavatus (strain ATCC 1007 / CBS 513.65 / DSM 816 / NCTC 3887 / NRRL 1 / QM 1276 / 107) TaxID=344612 RepID=A1CR53_ASPCL|nr:uncharacterized protein ACLA_028490 [Aspergillus clavatus NRRL 1]EAW08124.1 conserved hypothetical protein [Aspergillus clavatus NRRL 1]
MATPASIRGSMPWRTCSQGIRRQYIRPNHSLNYRNRFLSTTSPLRSAANNPLRSSRNARTREEEIAQYRRSMTLSAAGIAVCAVAMYGVIQMDLFGLSQVETADESAKNTDPTTTTTMTSKAMKLDGPEGFPSSPSVIRIQGQDGAERVATGTSTIPHFPSTIRLPKCLDDAAAPEQGAALPSGPGADEEEYQLLGLGIRTVSFLQVQVYVVGLYVAKSDISALQQRLVRTAVHPPGAADGHGVVVNTTGATSATSLVSTERQALKDLLLDPERGEAVWNAILRDDGLRTAFRIVPTRNTDFLHLRDGWVRGITARAQRAATTTTTTAESFQDEAFGGAMNDFKGLFGGGQRKSVPKGQTLVLMRNARGELNALFRPEPAEPLRFLGRVRDERIARLVWLNYLAGKTVASEGARLSVVDGVMGIVERPVGTVVQKVI